MSWPMAVLAIITIGLFIYLMAALIKPELFP